MDGKSMEKNPKFSPGIYAFVKSFKKINFNRKNEVK